MKRKSSGYLGLALGILLAGTQAQALPILAENAAQNYNGLITLYPDHEDSNKFYFMPNSSTFARSQTSQLPLFGLVYWGLNSCPAGTEAGGYMNFGMKLTMNPEQKQAIDEFLKSGRSIAVLPVQAATVGLSTTKEGSAPMGMIFEELNFSKYAGRAEDEVGVNAILTGIGAKVFRAGIDNPALFKVDYCYKVTGLGPNFSAKVEIDMNRVYTHFKATASGGNWWARVKISTEVEKLRDIKAIKIETNGGDASDREYIQALSEKIIAELFKPELQAKPSAMSEPKGWSFAKFSLQHKRVEELKVLKYQLTRREIVDREFCAPFILSDLNQYRGRVVQDAGCPNQ